MSEIGFSTGLRNALATNYGLGLMMNGGVLYVYGAGRPASADLAPGSTLLGRVTTEGKTFYPGADTEGAGLQLRFVPPGGLAQSGIWTLKGVAAGLATWFRWCWAGPDPLEDSEYYPRIDGDISTTLTPPYDGWLVLPNPALTPATNTPIESFLIVLPAS